MTALEHYILDAVRIGLSACVAGRPRRHPDSSRQRKTKQRDVTRYEVRRMKAQQSTYLPKLPSTTAARTYLMFDYSDLELRLLSRYGTDYVAANTKYRSLDRKAKLRGGGSCANADGLTTGRTSTRS